MRPPRKDLKDKQFFDWTVINFSHRKTYPNGSTANYWLCACSCGEVRELQQSSLLMGTSRRCARCSHGEPNGWRSNLYSTWAGIKGRCLNPNHTDYYLYGARGITIHPQWIKSFRAFEEYVGVKPGPEYSIDRWPNPHGNYEPGNVRWATPLQQRHNRR